MIENQTIQTLWSDGEVSYRKAPVANYTDKRRLLEVRVSESSTDGYNAFLLRFMAKHLSQTSGDFAGRSGELSELVKGVGPWPVVEDGDKKTDVYATISGTEIDLHNRYQAIAKEIGAEVLNFDIFWNKFRRCYPKSHCAWFSFYEQIRYEVCVMLQDDDLYLVSQTDDHGRFTDKGRDAVLERFVGEQDNLSGEPHPNDSEDGDLPWLEA